VIDGERYVQVISDRWSDGGNGYIERAEHVAMLIAWAPCILVMCEAVDLTTNSRTIKRFDEKTVYLGGELISRAELKNEFIETTNAVLVRLRERVPASQLFAPKGVKSLQL
jgi:hypothetical protein